MAKGEKVTMRNIINKHFETNVDEFVGVLKRKPELCKSKSKLLVEALNCGYYKIAEALIERGIGLQAKDSMLYTPLHLAVALNKTHLARAIIAQNCDLSAETIEGDTPVALLRKDAPRALVEALYEAYNFDTSLQDQV